MTFDLVNHVNLLKLFNPGDTIILALSGGVDSMVLFDVLKRLELTIIIAHVNHQRRPESQQEYDALKSLGNGKDIIFEGLTLTENFTGNFQEYARKNRIDFFKKLATNYKTNLVILAHHLDDQLESFLMRFTKGASFLSLGGMKTVETFDSIQFIRPFLSLSKATLIEYANTNAITFFTDSSNLSDDYTRNRFRHHVVPFLKEENPNLQEAFERFNDSLAIVTSRIQDEATLYIKNAHHAYPIDSFLRLDALVQESILTTLIREYTQEYSISKGLFSTIIEQLSTSDNNFDLTLTDDIVLRKSYRIFTIETIKPKSMDTIDILDVGSYCFESNKSLVVSHNKSTINTTNSFILWYNNKVFPLVFRTRRDGDRIKRPFGSKKLKDLFIDMKIPPKERDHLMLLASGNQVLWIPALNIQCTQTKADKKLYIYEVQKC